MSSNQKLSDLENHLKKLECRVNALEKKDKMNTKIIKSYNTLFSTILINHKVFPSELIQNSHDLNKELLIFVDNVCKKYGLDWWLYGGTLLGAVRHKGFIPWDDDCDITMMRKDYDNFIDKMEIELERTDLIDNIKVKPNTIVNKHLMAFTKIDYYHENTILGFIDLFPNDYINVNNSEIETKFKSVQKEALKQIRKRKDIDIVIEDVFNQLDLKRYDGSYIISAIENKTYFHIFDKDVIFPLNYIEFENHTFPVPNDYDAVLTDIYGDYMKLPRTVYDHSFYNKLATIKNSDELFEENINKLREVNKNFD